MKQDLLDRLAIRELVESWALWRDAGDWQRFRTVWHPDGRRLAVRGGARHTDQLTQSAARKAAAPAAAAIDRVSAVVVCW